MQLESRSLTGLPPSLPGFGLERAGAFPWRRESARLVISQWKQAGLLSSPCSYAAGVTIFDHNSVPDTFLLERGVVGFERERASREQSGMFALCLPGHLFGRGPDAASDSFVHSAIALTHCTVYRISRNRVLFALQRGGEPALFIIRQYLQNLLSARERAAESTARCTKSRLRQLLLELATALEDHSPVGSIRLPLKDKELAGILGISPQQFSVIKKELEKEKVITCSGEKNRLALHSGGNKVRFFKVYRYKRISGSSSSA